MNPRTLLPAAWAVGPAAPALLPTLAAVAPPVIAGLAIGAFVLWLLDDEEKEPTAEAFPPPLPAPRPQLAAPVVTGSIASQRSSEFQSVAPSIAARRSVMPAAPFLRVAHLPAPAPAMPSRAHSKPPAAKGPPSVAALTPPAPAATGRDAAGNGRKLTADRLAAVFAAGPLSRKAAVVALVAGGVSRSRAYHALREVGAFSTHLVSQPDGLMTWQV